MDFRKAITAACGAAGLALLTVPAHAALPVGDLLESLPQGTAETITLGGTAPAGAVEVFDESAPVIFSPHYQPDWGGTLESTVYKDSTGLLFEYQFVPNPADGDDTADTMSPGRFYGPISVGETGPGTGAQLVSYNHYGTVNFQLFGGGLGVPSDGTSALLAIQTTSTAIVQGEVGFTGGSARASAPAPAAPELSTFVPFAAAFGLYGLFAIRRRRSAGSPTSA
jgi:hypothetical protein